MNTSADLKPILQILLGAIAQECGTTQEFLSNEITQVALKALLAAHDIGEAHERITAIRPLDPNVRRPKGTF